MAFNVLIVDDSKTTRTIIAKALRHAEVELGEVHSAADGMEALDLLKDHWVDIIFADLNMPRLSGVEMVERMAENDILSSVPVVIVSTEGRRDRIDALLARGVAAYLRKPFAPEQVAAIANELLGAPAPDATLDDLQEAFYGAVEGFAMLVAQPLAEAPPGPEDAMCAGMRIVGAKMEGEILLATSAAGGVAIAECALGGRGEDSAQDAFRELLNVTAGHLVDKLPGGPFSLDLPASDPCSGTPAWSRVLECTRWLAFDVEGEPLVLGVTLRDRW